MKAKLLEIWSARSPVERAATIGAAVIVGIVLYAWFVNSADRARTQLRATITVLRAQAAGLEQQATELDRLRAKPPAPASTVDLRAAVQAQIDSAGLSGIVTRMEVRDANHVQVTLGAVAFAEWLALAGVFEAQQIRVESCRVEALSNPGLASVTATLARARP